MNVSELFQLTEWIDDEIKTPQVPQLYQALFAILQQHVQPNQPNQPFEKEKTELLETVRGVPLHQLSKDQLKFLESLEIAPFVGESGGGYIEDVLYRNVLDVATAAEKVQEGISAIGRGLVKSEQIRKGLAGCVDEEEYEVDDEVLMRISFAGNARMANVIDFRDWGKIWFEIGRGIAQAHGTAPEDIRIIGATRGSVVLELAVVAGIATTTSSIILAALKVAEKILHIKKTAEEIRGLKLQNNKYAAELEAEIETEKQAGVEAISVSLVKELKLKKNGDGDKITELERAIKNLVGFIESGGEVDFVLPAEDDESDEGEDGEGRTPDYSDLRVTFQEIRRIEASVRLLESGEV